VLDDLRVQQGGPGAEDFGVRAAFVEAQAGADEGDEFGERAFGTAAGAFGRLEVRAAPAGEGGATGGGPAAGGLGR
jgi:hypothetical protein